MKRIWKHRWSTFDHLHNEPTTEPRKTPHHRANCYFLPFRNDFEQSSIVWFVAIVSTESLGTVRGRFKLRYNTLIGSNEVNWNYCIVS